jgi:hypothetical protein
MQTSQASSKNNRTFRAKFDFGLFMWALLKFARTLPLPGWLQNQNRPFIEERTTSTNWILSAESISQTARISIHFSYNYESRSQTWHNFVTIAVNDWTVLMNNQSKLLSCDSFVWLFIVEISTRVRIFQTFRTIIQDIFRWVGPS